MKNYIMLFLLAAFVLWAVGQLDPNKPAYATVFHAFVANEPEQATEPTFARGVTDKQGQPCDDERGGVEYKSEILSREEVLHELSKVGFQGQMLEDMAAITLAESGRQVSCVADEHLTDGKWDVSYGVYSIRALKAEQGKGSCRDIDRLRRNDFADQTVCAWEISGNGTTYQPWSVTHTNRGKPYLKYLGQ